MNAIDVLRRLQQPGQTALQIERWFMVDVVPFVHDWAEYGRAFQHPDGNPHAIEAFLNVLLVTLPPEQPLIRAYHTLAGRSLLAANWFPNAQEHPLWKSNTIEWLYPIQSAFCHGAQYDPKWHTDGWSQLMAWNHEHSWIHDGLVAKTIEQYLPITHTLMTALTQQRNPGPLSIEAWIKLRQTTPQNVHWAQRKIQWDQTLSEAYPEASQRIALCLDLMPTASLPTLVSAVATPTYPSTRADLSLPLDIQ